MEKQWRTEARGKTSASGEFTTGGFLGRYEISASAKGRCLAVKFFPGKEGEPVVITLKWLNARPETPRLTLHLCIRTDSFGT